MNDSSERSSILGLGCEGLEQCAACEESLSLLLTRSSHTLFYPRVETHVL